METVAPLTQNHSSRICTRCVLDTSVPGIRFDAAGICQYCKIHDQLEQEFPLDEHTQLKLEKIVQQIKRAGQGKAYDVIVGVSGGRDSTYGLYTAVKLGLRPLAVHLDNGWNSEIAVTNIKKAVTRLGIDLHTHVLDWEEFKDLQIAFLKASVSDAEIPTDVAIHGLLHRVAAAEGVRYIVFAHSFQTEGFSPLGWSYMDGRYIESVHKKFGHRVLKTYPNFTLRDYLYYRWVKGIKVFPLLAYVPYRPEEVRGLLEKELDWQYYGGHHHESYYTHFFHSYYLPKKFGVDKRKLTYSALIRSGQITRREVLDRVLAEAYPYDEELVQYTVSKLGLSPEEFRQIMAAPRRTFHDYPTYYPLIKNCRGLIALAARFNIFPKHLYLKYLG